jgi:hypothetical protein
MLRRQPPIALGWPPLPPASDRRWLWLGTTAVGFFSLLIWVFRHDDPAPGLSERGWATVTLAALLLVLLSVHRAHGGWALLRATAEYAVVAALAVLLATTSGAGAGVHHPPATPPARAGQARQQPAARHPARAGEAAKDRPGVLQAVTGVRDWLVGLWRQATQQADRSAPSSTTRAPRRARAPSWSWRWRAAVARASVPRSPTIPPTRRSSP